MLLVVYSIGVGW